MGSTKTAGSKRVIAEEVQRSPAAKSITVLAGSVQGRAGLGTGCYCYAPTHRVVLICCMMLLLGSYARQQHLPASGTIDKVRCAMSGTDVACSATRPSKSAPRQPTDTGAITVKAHARARELTRITCRVEPSITLIKNGGALRYLPTAALRDARY
eukprot:1130779-Rhodomonas_salina.1